MFTPETLQVSVICKSICAIYVNGEGGRMVSDCSHTRSPILTNTYI